MLKEATINEIFDYVISLYNAFYQKYGIDQNLDADALMNFLMQALLKEGKEMNFQKSIQVTQFAMNIAENPGAFPEKLRLFKQSDNSKDSVGTRKKFEDLLDVMNSKGFIFE